LPDSAFQNVRELKKEQGDGNKKTAQQNTVALVPGQAALLFATLLVKRFPVAHHIDPSSIHATYSRDT